jgi:hypothetical protein
MCWVEDGFGLLFLPFALLLVLLLAIVYGFKRGLELVFKESE